MTKWIWRLSDPVEHNFLWFKLLQAKYFNTDNIFAATSQGGSQFWRNVNKIKHLFKLGAKYHVEKGEKVCFWTDWWVGDAPLAIRFPRLFDICTNQNIFVAHALPVSPSSLHFWRSFGPEDRELWSSLVHETSVVSLSLLPDSASWGLESNDKFLVSSLYRKINQGPSLPHESLLWSAKLRLKIKIFLWQMAKGRLPSNAQINRRHGASDGNCALCGQFETVDHIFFTCHLASFAWSGIREALGVQWNSQYFQDFFLISLSSSFKTLIWMLFAAQSWVLWNIRNKISIKHKLPSQLLAAFSKPLSSYSYGVPCYGASLIRRWSACWTCFAPYTCKRVSLPQELWLLFKSHMLALLSAGKCCQEPFICMACNVVLFVKLVVELCPGLY
jgi:hypothetical protein